MKRVSGTTTNATRETSKGRTSLAVAAAVAGMLAAGNIAYADVMLSNFEGSLGNGVQGWFDYNGNVSNIGVTNAPTGGAGNWMHIGYTTGTYTNAGPTIQPWANSNFNNANFQAHNFLHLDVIFPSTGPNAWLSNQTLPVYINSNGGPGDGIQLGTVDTSIKDTKQHLALDYSAHKSSNGGALSVTDWMNLLFGHADEAQWGAEVFNPYVYVDNIQFTTSATLPPEPPAPANGTWDATKSGAWSVAGNWVGAIAANGEGNTATFPQADAPRTVNVDAVPIGVGTLTIDSTSGYTIAGNALSIDSGNTAVAGAVNVNAASGDHVISAPLSMARSTTFTVAGSSSLFVNSLSGGGFGADEGRHRRAERRQDRQSQHQR